MGQIQRKMVVHSDWLIIVRSLQAMKRFALRRQIVSVLVLILATTVWLPRAQWGLAAGHDDEPQIHGAADWHRQFEIFTSLPEKAKPRPPQRQWDS